MAFARKLGEDIDFLLMDVQRTTDAKVVGLQPLEGDTEMNSRRKEIHKDERCTAQDVAKLRGKFAAERET